MIVGRTTELAEQLLTNGELRCPHCTNGQLTPWGHGRQRTVRDLAGTTVTVQRCYTRQKDSGTGVSRPLSTGRCPRCAAGFAAYRPPIWSGIYRDGTQRLLALDPDTFTTLRRTGTMLHYALSILAAAAHWERHRYGISDPPWTLIGLYTRGRLLAPPGGPHHEPPSTLGGVVGMPELNRHHDDHRVTAPKNPSPCRPTPEITSSSTVTASSASSATANSSRTSRQMTICAGR